MPIYDSKKHIRDIEDLFDTILGDRNLVTDDELRVSNNKLVRHAPTWTVLGDYEASVEEASHDFTFTAVDFDDDSKLVLIVDISAVLVLSLRMQINDDTSSNYFTDGRLIAGGVETLIDLNGKASFQILSTDILSAVNIGGFAEITIGLNKAGTSDRPIFISKGGSGSGPKSEDVSGTLNKAIANISSIKVTTSTSNWQIGTRMTLYKVSRT